MVATGNLLLVVLAASLLIKLSCRGEDWTDDPPYSFLCYTDILPFYEQRGLAEGRIPYFQAANEYPVLTGLFMEVAALPASTNGDFLATNALLLSALAVAVTVMLHRLVGARARYFAFAPALFLYAFLNWDLLAVTLTTGATVALLRRRDGLSGLLLGLGAAAKLYPALLVVPFALDRYHRGDRRCAARLTLTAATVWGAVNLPVALFAFHEWSLFFRFSSARPPTQGTVWSVACRAVTGDFWCRDVELVNVASLTVFVAAAAFVWWITVRRAPEFARWTFAFPLLLLFLLTNKVFSPQYGLWLLPWFALVLPDLRLFLALAAADVAVFLTEFSALAREAGVGHMPLWALDLAVIARVAVLVLLLRAYIRRAGHAVAFEPAPSGAIGGAPSFR